MFKNYVIFLIFNFILQNIRNGVREGTSVHLNYFTLSVHSIKSALLEALENPKYFQNAQKRSRLFRDQPNKPIDRADFWIEWLLRHIDDYSVIRLPITDLGVVVSNSYDVMGFLIAVFLLIISTMFYCVKKTCLRRGYSEINNQVKEKSH